VARKNWSKALDVVSLILTCSTANTISGRASGKRAGKDTNKGIQLMKGEEGFGLCVEDDMPAPQILLRAALGPCCVSLSDSAGTFIVGCCPISARFLVSRSKMVKCIPIRWVSDIAGGLHCPTLPASFFGHCRLRTGMQTSRDVQDADGRLCSQQLVYSRPYFQHLL